MPAHRLSLLAAAVLAATTATAAPPRATLQVIAPPGGVGSSFALGLNDAGQVVGHSLESGSFGTALLWDAVGGSRAVPGVGLDGRANGINERGQVVGDYVVNPRLGQRRAYVWDPALGLRVLPPEFTNTQAEFGFAINSAGSVAGEVSSGPAVWAAGGGPRVLGTEPGSARGLDDSGRAVGSVVVAGQRQARRWLADGTVQALGTVGSDTQSEALGTNAAGQVVGWSAGTERVAMVWSADRGMRSLGHLGGGSSQAQAINAAGQVVGTSRLADGRTAAFLWQEGTGLRNLNGLIGTALAPTAVNAINAHAQLVGSGLQSTGESRGFLLTLHPDWTGGDGAWDDTTGTRWNWAGTGTAAARVGAMHDVVIDPGFSVTVKGSTEGAARTLRLGGTAGTLVTLDLNGGSTRIGDGGSAIYNPSSIGAGGVLRGHGRLEVREDLKLLAGGRIQVDGGQQMQLAIDYLDNQGLIRAQGTAAAPARLEVTGGAFYNQAGAMVQLVQADAVLDSGLSNFGQVSVQSASLTLGAGTRLFNFKAAQVGFGFGDSVVNGRIENQGLLAVSNGARVTFTGALVNTGELRVSAGGAADFFGLVSGTGAIKGDGEMRFEGGFTVGGPTRLAIAPDAVFASEIALKLDGLQGLAFAGDVRLDGATLALTWDSSLRTGAGSVYDLFDWNGTLSGRFDRVALPGLSAGLAWDTSDLYAGGTVSIAAVPEPGTWALWAAGLLGLSSAARRAERPSRAASRA